MIKRININQLVFLALVFGVGMIHQPNWAYENFWSKADFYDSLPFVVPYLVFALIYSAIQTSFAGLCIKLIKKYF